MSNRHEMRQTCKNCIAKCHHLRFALTKSGVIVLSQNLGILIFIAQFINSRRNDVVLIEEKTIARNVSLIDT